MRPPIDKYRTLQFGSYAEIKECGYNYGKILFDTWIKHAGSIEKFLYKKNNKVLNNALKKSKVLPSPEKSFKPNNQKAGENTKSRLSTAYSNFHFEDLSQFVSRQKTLKSNDTTEESTLKSEKSILKKDLNKAGHDDQYFDQIRQFKHSKSVQINNENNIYGLY
jgi:hypothetical protein